MTLGLPAPPASAITGGEPDADRHPAVGAVLAFVPNRPRPLLCTGVLVHPRVVLTAGYCLYGFLARGIAAPDVGYGATLELSPPIYLPVDGVRQLTFSELQGILPAHQMMNGNQPAGNGGVCFYDSGGPAFWLDPAQARRRS